MFNMVRQVRLFEHLIEKRNDPRAMKTGFDGFLASGGHADYGIPVHRLPAPKPAPFDAQLRPDDPVRHRCHRSGTSPVRDALFVSQKSDGVDEITRIDVHTYLTACCVLHGVTAEFARWSE